MTELFSKLSTYNLFNYLLPGVIFAVLVHNFTSYSLLYDNILISIFLYYFIGLIISRIGSLLIEPVLKKMKLLKFESYENFVFASKEDDKIETLSEVNNMYRTFLSLSFVVLLLKLFEELSIYLGLEDMNIYILLGVLILLFLFSYIKQTSYIKSRILRIVKLK